MKFILFLIFISNCAFSYDLSFNNETCKITRSEFMEKSYLFGSDVSLDISDITIKTKLGEGEYIQFCLSAVNSFHGTNSKTEEKTRCKKRIIGENGVINFDDFSLVLNSNYQTTQTTLTTTVSYALYTQGKYLYPKKCSLKSLLEDDSTGEGLTHIEIKLTGHKLNLEF